MWHGGSSAQRKCVDKQIGQPVECFCLPWGLSRGLLQLLTIKIGMLTKLYVGSPRNSLEWSRNMCVCVCVCGLVHGRVGGVGCCHFCG